MRMAPFSAADHDLDRLNFFKFCVIVLREFPVVLREVFVYMWDNHEVQRPGSRHPKWDDSDAIRKLFLKEEGGETNVPTTESLKDWNSAALFEATLFAKAFGKPDASGRRRTLKQVYVKCQLSPGAFHPRLRSGRVFRSECETFALALDQLRLLRNALCYHMYTNERKIDKENFDRYLSLARDAFNVLDQESTKIVDIGNLASDDFPSGEFQRLENELTREKEAAIKFGQMEKLDDEDMKIGETNLKKMVENAGSDLKGINTAGVTIEKKNIQDAFSGSQDTKPGKTDEKAEQEKLAVKESVETGSRRVMESVEDDNSGKGGESGVNVKLKHVGADWRDVGGKVPNVQTKGDGVRPDLMNVKTGKERDAAIKDGISTPVSKDDEKTGSRQVQREVQSVAESKQNSIKTYVDDDKCAGTTGIVDQSAQAQANAARARFYDKREKIPLTDEMAKATDAVREMKRYCERKLIDRRSDEKNKNMENGVNFSSTKSENVNREATGFGSEEKDVNIGKTMVKILMNTNELGSDLKDVTESRTVIRDVKDKLEDVESANLETEVKADATANIENVVTDSRDVKSGPPVVQTKVVEVSGRTDIQNETTRLPKVKPKPKPKPRRHYACKKNQSENQKTQEETNVKTKGEETDSANVRTDVKSVARYFERKPNNQNLERNNRDVTIGMQKDLETRVRDGKTGEKDLKTENNVVKSDAKNGEIDVNRRLEDCGPDGKYMKTGETDVKTEVEDVGFGIKDVVKAGITDVTPSTVTDLTKKAGAVDSYAGQVAVDQKERKGSTDENFKVLQTSSFGTAGSNTSLRDLASTLLEMSEEQEARSNSDEKFLACSYHNLGVKKIERGDLNGALESLQKAVELSGEPSSDDTQPAQTLVSLGIVYLLMGDNKLAVESLQKAADMLSHVLNDHKQTANAYFLLGLAQSRTKDVNGAMESLQMASRLHKELLGDDAITAASLHELGRACLQLGDHKAAIEAFQEAADMRSKVLGDHEKTAYSYYCLGSAQLCQEDPGSALNPLKKASEINQKVKGDHIDTASSFHQLGRVCLQLGDNTSAIEVFQVAAEMRLKVLGNHRDTAHSYYCLGSAQLRIQNHRTALNSLKKASKINEAINGDQLNIAAKFHELGSLCLQLDDNKSAIEAFQGAAEMRSKMLGDHEDTAYSYFCLGSAQLREEDFSAALDSLQKASEMNEKMKKDPNITAASFHFLGSVYLAINDATSAVEPLQQAARTRSEFLGDHEHTAESYFLLGVAQLETGDLTGSLKSYLKASQLRKDILKEHPDTALSLYHLGNVYLKTKNKRSALESIRAAAEMNAKVLGEHVTTAMSYHLLGALEFDTGDLEGAELSLQEASRLRKKLLGEGHPESIESLQLLNAVQDALTVPKY